MAIKVGGTSVIDNSRNLQNIASIDAATEAAITAAGFSQTTGDITGVTAGSGLSGGGTSGTVTVNHADTSSQGSVNNSGNAVIQDITLDTYGHITNINSTTIATASTSAGAVGTYVFAKSSGTSTRFLFGSTYAGSSLRAAGLSVQSSSAYWVNGADDNSGLSGTWRAMGENDHSNSSWYSLTLFVRIS